MAKLYFRYGTVSSAKTLNLLAVAHNYRQQGKHILLIKPLLDTRFSEKKIKSRAGLEQTADLLVDSTTELPLKQFDRYDCILVDEVQFIAPSIIDQLRHVATHMRVPVICYGLRADFRTNAFPGSQRLFELADSIEEIKTTCAYCAKKAIMNLKHKDGIATLEGPSVDLGAEEKYFPACYGCYEHALGEGRALESNTVGLQVLSQKIANS